MVTNDKRVTRSSTGCDYVISALEEVKESQRKKQTICSFCLPSCEAKQKESQCWYTNETE